MTQGLAGGFGEVIFLGRVVKLLVTDSSPSSVVEDFDSARQVVVAGFVCVVTKTHLDCYC